MAKRVYEEFDIDIDAIPDELRDLTLNAGQVYNLSGLVFQGNGKELLVMFPTANKVMIADTYDYPLYVLFNDVLNPDFQELQAIIKRTDDPLIFEKDETGVLKAIVRKSQRVVSGAVQQQIWHRDGYQCMFCGKKIPQVQLTVDHFVPLEKGGANDPSNYLSCCRACNKHKGNQDPEAYCMEHNYDYLGLSNYVAGKAPKSFIFHLG